MTFNLLNNDEVAITIFTTFYDIYCCLDQVSSVLTLTCLHLEYLARFFSNSWYINKTTDLSEWNNSKNGSTNNIMYLKNDICASIKLTLPVSKTAVTVIYKGMRNMKILKYMWKKANCLKTLHCKVFKQFAFFHLYFDIFMFPMPFV